MIENVYFSLLPDRACLNRLVVFIALSLLTLLNSQAQSIRYVRPGPAGNGDGTSWANATSDLQGAINSLTATGGQVWVANGLYKPTVFTGPDSRTVSFALTSGVAIYGGFAGNETALSERRVSYPSSTTLSGNIGDESTNADNSHNVLLSMDVDTTALLDGFVITGGNAYGDTAVSNGSGGGLYSERSSIRLNNCFFQANVASSGGAIYSLSNPSVFSSGPRAMRLRMTNCTFQDNVAEVGGAIFINSTNHSTTDLVMINCTFQGNSVPSFGYGGAIYVGNANTVDLINCSFQNNSAYYGGLLAVYTTSASSFVNFKNCVAFNNGGASTIYRDNAVIASYCLFDQSVTGYDSDGTTLVTTTSPFASATSTQLAACSPAIDAGDPTSTTATSGPIDLAGNPRFIRAHLDMGAYELQTEPCNGELFTLQNGRWDNTSTWSKGRLPTSSDIVHLKHSVTIPQNYVANAHQLTYELAVPLIYEAGGRLLVNP